ncbi:MAG: His/Gly/Thr/Pro-type tRNA ligase C-terminal domain-containing protein [Oscillospiraceae bacterium]|nr:His/Gly/Thr/Pro-type tRNA ligase C-terminal domain-containing protein [Oscillospiraceae bacterium]
MKLEKLIGERFRDKPTDTVISSHALMMRGGYMKQVAGGIFSQQPILRRITRKIEQIIREEMDRIDGQEVLFPVVMPASLWQESGRYDSIGNELARFADRNGSPMLLGMTHEEAAVHLVREYGAAHTKYPFMIYQIQTKFRDEARPRGGLIRVREFTMKDAYSFHTSQEDLEIYYSQCFHAYERIFRRVGLPEVIAVTADSGMMGGKVSHEFMLLTPVGEDSIVICGNCDYRANLEAAGISDGETCPQCNQLSLSVSRGIEVGNIFQLGDRYTKAMGMRYADAHGSLRYPVMGCYGVGIERLAASVCEVRHDDYGPRWPISIAPWQVHICCVRADNAEVKSAADELYRQFYGENIEAIYDDRVISAGVMFSDADLIGAPIRVILSPRNMRDNCCEIITRDKAVSQKVKRSEVAETVQGMIGELLAETAPR